MGQHFTLGAGPAQIMGQHVLPRLYGCRRLWLVGDSDITGEVSLAESENMTLTVHIKCFQFPYKSYLSSIRFSQPYR